VTVQQTPLQLYGVYVVMDQLICLLAVQ